MKVGLCSRRWDVFSQFDADHDHRLSLEEFIGHIDSLGLRFSPSQARHEFHVIDANGKGMILFSECATPCKPQRAVNLCLRARHSGDRTT